MDVAAASFFGSTTLLGAAVAEAAVAGADFRRAVEAFADLPLIAKAATAPAAVVAQHVPPSLSQPSVRADRTAVAVGDARAVPAILIPGRTGPMMLPLQVAAQPPETAANDPQVAAATADGMIPVQIDRELSSVLASVVAQSSVKADGAQHTAADKPADRHGMQELREPTGGEVASDSAPTWRVNATDVPDASPVPATVSPGQATPVVALPNEAPAADTGSPVASRRKLAGRPMTDEEHMLSPTPRVPSLGAESAMIAAHAPVVAGQADRVQSVPAQHRGQADVRATGPLSDRSQPIAPRDARPLQSAAFPSPVGSIQVLTGGPPANRQSEAAAAAFPDARALPAGEVVLAEPGALSPQPRAETRAKRVSESQPSATFATRSAPLPADIRQSPGIQLQPASPPPSSGDQPLPVALVMVPEVVTPTTAEAPTINPPASGSAAPLAGTPGPPPAPPGAATAVPVPMPYRAAQLAHDTGIVVAHRISNGDREVTIRMEPADFGRIDVRMSFDDSGKLRATVGADNPLVLDLLRRDVANLVGAMSDAGISSDQRSFRFEAQADSSQGQRAGTNGDGQPRDPRQQPGREPFLRPAEEPESTVFQPLRWTGQIDVTA